MNFLEARKAALEGKKVRIVGRTIVFLTEDFQAPLPWAVTHFDSEWEIVDEPKLTTYYIGVRLETEVVRDYAFVYTKLERAKAYTDHNTIVAITVDKDGKLVKAENV